MPAAVDEKRNEELRRRLVSAIVAERAAGAAIALWTPDRVELAAVGHANQEAGIEADDRTIFQIGSITKVFTATLLFALKEQGLVDLDQSVGVYLPAFRIAGREPPAALTVRSLLNYTSGIAGEFFADFGPDDSALERYVAACAPLPLIFDPQTMRGYSSTAYCVAGRIAEVVSGLSFNQALVRNVLGPLCLRRTAFYTHDIARFRTAVGHVAMPDGGFRQAGQLRLPHCMSPTGASLSMSAEDLLQFGLMHMRGGLARVGSRVLSAAHCAEMIDDGLRLPPDDAPALIGWAEIQTDRGRMIAASGQTIEHNAVLAFSPRGDFALAILANTAGAAQRLFLSLGAELLKERADTLLSRPKPPAIDPDALKHPERYVGLYTNHTRAEVSGTGAGLRIRFLADAAQTPGPAVSGAPLMPLGGDSFAVENGPSLRFLFQHGDHAASHFSWGGAIFGRCDASGATRYPSP